MSNINLVVSETGTRVIDPITESVWRQVLTQLGVIQYFPDRQIYITNDRSAASAVKDDDGNANLLKNRVDIEVETVYTPTAQQWNTATDHNVGAAGNASRWTDQYRSIFLDKDAKFSIQEVTQPFGLNFTFKLTFLSADLAQRALMALNSQNVGSVINHVHDIVYSYPLDTDALCIIWAVFKNKMAYPKKDGASLLQYISDMSQAKIGLNIRRESINVNGQAPENQLAVKRYQLDCQALLQVTSTKPEPVIENNVPEAFTVGFTYQLQFGCPMLLQFTLPPVVDNKPLPYALFKNNNEGFVKQLQGGMQTQCFDSVLRYMAGGMYSVESLVRIPPHDDWTVPKSSLAAGYGYKPFFLGIVLISPGTPASIEINDLGDVTIGQFVKEMLALHSPDDIFGTNGLFNITFFCDNVALDRSIVSWDPTTLTASFTGSRPSGIYRAVISEVGDLRQVDPKWYPTLLKYRYYFPMTVFRNLNYLASLGYYSITPSGELVKLINTTRNKGLFDRVVSAMIATGECDTTLRQFTQTSEQFADYICNTQATLTYDPTVPSGTMIPTGDTTGVRQPSIPTTNDAHDKVGRVLYDTFVQVCIAMGIISSMNVPGMYVRTPKGYPYGPGQGGFPDFQIPLRVMYVNIQTPKK